MHDTKEERIGVGLIGFGLAGRALHAPLIAAERRLSLVAVASSRPAQVAALHPFASTHATVEALLADQRIELIVIAAPNAVHASLARAALVAGKHVVVDKPFVLDRVEGRALDAMARERGKVLAVFHNRRWDADFLTVSRLIASGTLGRVSEAALIWDRFRPAIKPGWRERPGPGAGVFADLGSHLADQALALFGVPERITGDIAIQRDGALVDDWFNVTLSYGRCRVTLAASTLAAAPRPRFLLRGDRGSFVKHGIDPQEEVLRAGGSPNGAGFGVEPAAAWGLLTTADGVTAVSSERGDWRAFYAGVATAIRDGAPAPVTATEALAGLTLLDLARRSAEEGRTLYWADNQAA